MKVFSYARVSHQDQKTRETIVNQENAMKRYLEQHPDLEIVEKFKDEAISGARADRPGFLAMLERIDEVDGIITYDISRLTRDLEIWNYIMFTLRNKKKILIKVKTGEIDNYSSERTKMLTGFIEGWAAENERVDISSRVKEGIRTYRAREGRWGRKGPVIDWAKYEDYKTRYDPPMPITLICQMEDIATRETKEGKTVRCRVSRNYLYKQLNLRK